LVAHDDEKNLNSTFQKRNNQSEISFHRPNRSISRQVIDH
jgi:hypothetical protein